MLPTFYVTLFGYVGLATIGRARPGAADRHQRTDLVRPGELRRAGGLCHHAADQIRGAPPIAGLVAGLAVTGAIAWLLGLITARLSGHFLALVSVAWGISFFSLFGTLPVLHGFNGIGDIPPLRSARFGREPACQPGRHPGRRGDCDGDVGESAGQPHGPRDPHAERRAADGREHGHRHRSAEPQVFVIAALYAGIAGFLFAHFQRFVSPTPFGLGASIDYLFMVIIGGAESLWGAPIGATLVVLLRDQFNDWIPRITGRAGRFRSAGVQPRRDPAAATRAGGSAAVAGAPDAPADQRNVPHPVDVPTKHRRVGAAGRPCRGRNFFAGSGLAAIWRAGGESGRDLRRAREARSSR